MGCQPGQYCSHRISRTGDGSLGCRRQRMEQDVVRFDTAPSSYRGNALSHLDHPHFMQLALVQQRSWNIARMSFSTRETAKLDLLTPGFRSLVRSLRRKLLGSHGFLACYFALEDSLESADEMVREGGCSHSHEYGSVVSCPLLPTIDTFFINIPSQCRSSRPHKGFKALSFKRIR
jgi:hypothetical protein